MPLWQELPLLLVVAFCLAVLIRTFLLQAFFIPSARWRTRCSSATGCWSTRSSTTCATRSAARSSCSGAPTRGRREIAEIGPTGLLRQARPHRRRPGRRQPAGREGLHQAGHRRCPATRVACCDAEGRVMVNGTALDEPYMLTTNSPLDAPPTPGECRLAAVRRGRGAGRAALRDGRPPRRLAGLALPGPGADRERDRAGVRGRVAERAGGTACRCRRRSTTCRPAVAPVVPPRVARCGPGSGAGIGRYRRCHAILGVFAVTGAFPTASLSRGDVGSGSD